MINTQLVINAMHKFIELARSSGKFTPQNLVDYMEPVFQKAGYRESHDPSRPVEVLITRTDAAGDFILFSPFLREIRRIYAGAHIALLCSKDNWELAEDCPYVDNVIRIVHEEYYNDYSLAGLKNAFQEAARLLEYNFDIAFFTSPNWSTFTKIIGYMSGASQHVGLSSVRRHVLKDGIINNGYDVFLTDVVPYVETPLHETDRSLMVIEHLLKCYVANRMPELWYSEQDARYAEALLAPLRQAGYSRFICCTPAGSKRNKSWPLERYAELFNDILSQEPETAVVVMGGPDIAAECSALATDIMDGRAIAVAGQCSFAESAALTSLLDVFIGCDTCLLHMSAAARLPVLTPNCYPMSLGFDPYCYPVIYAPYHVPAVMVLPSEPRDGCAERMGCGCHRYDEPHCILEISVDDMKRGYELLKQKVQAKDARTFYLGSQL